MKNTAIVLPRNYDEPSLRWRMWAKMRDDYAAFKEAHSTGGRDAYLKHIGQVIEDSEVDFVLDGADALFNANAIYSTQNSRNISNFLGVTQASAPKRKTSTMVLRFIHCYLLTKYPFLTADLVGHSKYAEKARAFRLANLHQKGEDFLAAYRKAALVFCGIFASEYMETHGGTLPAKYVHHEESDSDLLIVRATGIDCVLSAHHFVFDPNELEISLKSKFTELPNIICRRSCFVVPSKHRHGFCFRLDFTNEFCIEIYISPSLGLFSNAEHPLIRSEKFALLGEKLLDKYGDSALS